MVLTETGLAKVLQRIKSFVASQLNSKASAIHTHTSSDITDLPNGYVVDSTLDGTSSNAIANSAVSNALDDKANSSHTHTKSDITDFPTLATVATSGSYNDLSNKPTIPSKTSDLSNDSGFLTSLPTASSTLGGVKTTSTVSNSSGYTACPIISGVPYYKDTNTNTWTAMVGATSSANGSVGYVNAVPPKDGYNTKYLRADGTWQVPPDHTYTLSSLGIGNVKNYDQSKAIKSISRNGTTFTYTCLDGTTGTFTQQDNNTTYSFSDKNVTLAWGTKSTIATVGGTDIHVTMPANPNTNTTYSAGKGISLSGTTFSLKEWDVISTRTSAGSWSVSGNDKLFLIHFNIKSPQFNACSATLSVGNIICARYSLPTNASYRTEIMSSTSFFESGLISNSSDTLYGVALVFGESNTITINFSGPVSSVNIRTFQLRR